MVATKKNNKKAGDNVNAKLALVTKSGKYVLGLKSTLKTLREGKSLVVIIADNLPKLAASEVEYYTMLAKCDVYKFPGSNNALGTACGRLFPVSVLAITDVGDSDILSVVEKTN